MDYLPQNSNRLNHGCHECSLSLWHVMLTLSIIGITSFSNGRGAESWRFNGVISMEIRVPLREWWLTCPAGGILILTPTYISYLSLHLLIIPSFTCMYLSFLCFLWQMSRRDANTIRFRGWRNYGGGKGWNWNFPVIFLPDEGYLRSLRENLERIRQWMARTQIPESSTTALLSAEVSGDGHG